MNYAQFGLFGVFVGAVFCAGMWVYHFLNTEKNSYLNRYVHLGEVFLLGSILLVGQMFLLSFAGLYRAPFLWGIVLLQYTLLLIPNTRKGITAFMSKKPEISIPAVIFVLLACFFIFRNYYFLMDIDSHSYYLFAQRLWLEKGTSIVGSIDTDYRILAPHFDAVPYALGISLFKAETLFPQFINMFWRLIVLLLVFGYTKYRFNGYYGLAAMMLVLFNDHIFYSGVNTSVVINGVVIALLFAAVYNFWEAGAKDDPFYFLMGLLFASQLLANKYQMIFVIIFMMPLVVFIQASPMKTIKAVLKNQRWLSAVLVSILFVLFWPIKNWIVTGLPSFPMLAGKFGAFDWTPELNQLFVNLIGAFKLNLCLKYISYMFIWPGVKALKYIIIFIIFLPLILVAGRKRCNEGSNGQNVIYELCFWLGTSFLLVFALCLIAFSSVRGYRFPIAVASFSVVFALDYILRNICRIRIKFISIAIILLVCSSGYKIIFQDGGSLQRPTIKDNMDVILNRVHMRDILDKYYPWHQVAEDGFNNNKEKAMRSAWNTAIPQRFSNFLLPLRPQVCIWFTSIIKWDSYETEEAVVKDLKDYGIDYVMTPTADELLFMTPEDYAKKAVTINRFPKKIYYDYGFPSELTVINN